ncbi:hypothetical protein [Nocardia sp. NBC_00511]|uniref:hypothetical protein n=1 Tax=Nocardia sp. NBC_00511 TaxID=2903591 RepID=UPI0030E4BFA5
MSRTIIEPGGCPAAESESSMLEISPPVSEEVARQALSRLEFADAILRAAAGPERIGAVVDQVVRRHLEACSLEFGPRGLLAVDAVVRAEDSMVSPDPDDHRTFMVEIPLLIRFEARLVGLTARYLAGVHLTVRLTLDLTRPCVLVVRLHPVRAEDLTVRVKGLNTFGRITIRVVPLAALLATTIATRADALFTDPRLTDSTRIDVLDLIERAWDAGLVGRVIPAPAAS